MKHSVYTTHVGLWLHRHRLVHTHTRAYTHAHAHAYTGWPESGVGLDARATRSIRHVTSCASTPRNRRCTPSTPPLSLLFLFLSFSPILSSIHRLPLCTVADVFAHPREEGRYGGNGLSAGRRLGKEILRSAEFFDTRFSWTMQKKKEKKNNLVIHENLSGERCYSTRNADFFRKIVRV